MQYHYWLAHIRGVKKPKRGAQQRLECHETKLRLIHSCTRFYESLITKLPYVDVIKWTCLAKNRDLTDKGWVARVTGVSDADVNNQMG